MQSGDIYWVNLDPTIGHEIRKRRPVIVINGGHDKHLKLAIVVPITEWDPKWGENPFFVPVEADRKSGLKKNSVVDCFQIRAISHSRFSERVGEVPGGVMDRIKSSLALILDIDPEHCE